MLGASVSPTGSSGIGGSAITLDSTSVIALAPLQHRHQSFRPPKDTVFKIPFLKKRYRLADGHEPAAHKHNFVNFEHPATGKGTG